MTQEVLDQQTAEPTAEELQHVEQAAFESAFAEVSGQEPPTTQDPAPSAPEAPEDPAPAEADTESEGEIVDEIIPQLGLPASKVKEMLAKATDVDRLQQEYTQHRDRLYGMVGSLKQELQKVASQPAQGGVRLSPEAFKRLRGEYPELAELLAQDLSEAMTSQSAPAPTQAPAFDPSSLEQILAQREQAIVEQMNRQYEAKLLSMAHPDWRDVAQSTEFKLWKDMLPEDAKVMLDSSWDATVLAQGLNQFKRWREEQSARPVQKKNRLERAVQPTGIPATADTATEYDAFLEGFKAMRGV